MMKKLLGIVVLGLLFCVSAYSEEKSCDGKIDSEWDKWQKENYITLTITSSCEHPIYMEYFNAVTEEGKVIKKNNLKHSYLRPYGVKDYFLYIGDVNQDIIKKVKWLYALSPHKLGSYRFTQCRNGLKYKVYEKDSENNYELIDDPKKECEKIQSKQKKNKSPTKNWNKSPTNNWVVPSSADTGIWLWVGLGIAFLIIFMMAGSLDNQSSSKKKLKKVDKQKNISTGQNIIEKVWSGNETMAKTFWLYCILVTGVLSFIGGMLMPIIGIFVLIVPAIVIVWSNIGLWNSSTNYKLVQLNKKQSYGWATAAKVFVVLNFITTLSQAGFLLRGF